MWDLIVSVPDHCLSFYFPYKNCDLKFCSCDSVQGIYYDLKFRTSVAIQELWLEGPQFHFHTRNILWLDSSVLLPHKELSENSFLHGFLVKSSVVYKPVQKRITLRDLQKVFSYVEYWSSEQCFMLKRNTSIQNDENKWGDRFQCCEPKNNSRQVPIRFISSYARNSDCRNLRMNNFTYRGYWFKLRNQEGIKFPF